MAPPRRWPRPGRLPALSALVAVVVLAAGVPLVLAHALSPAPASPHPGVAPPQTWSTLDSSSSNSSEATFNTTYQIDSYYYDSLAITATNLSSTTVEIESVLTSITNDSETGCAKPCTPSGTIFQTGVSSDSIQVYFENFTTRSTVLVNGSSQPALGVLNARESLTTHSSASVSGVSPLGVPISGTMRGYSAGNNAFDFPGSFGIVPWTVPSVLPWNGSASFNDSSQFGQNYTTTGIFSNLSELFSSGGVGTPLAPMVAQPGNGSSGDSGNGSTGVISVPPPFGIGFGYYGGMMTFCTPPYASNNTTGMGSAGTIPYDPWQNASCSTSTSGTESAMGNEYNYPYFANASGAGMNRTGGPAVVGFTGPYVPGPALGEIVSGSDLFGGAAGSWPPLEVLEGYFGYGIGPGGPGYLGSGGSGGYSGMPPTPPPPPAAFPTIRTTPLAPANSPSSSSPMISAGTLVLVAAVVIAGLAGCLGTAFLMRRRPGVPPPPTGPR